MHSAKLSPPHIGTEHLGHSFLPHDDGLSLFVSPQDQSEWHIRLQWRPDAQGPIVDELNRFIRPEA